MQNTKEDRCFFHEHIDHGDGKHTLFGRVAADVQTENNTRHAHIPVPDSLVLTNRVVHTVFSTADPNDPLQYTPFFQFAFDHKDPRQIIVKAIGPKTDTKYDCDYVVVATARK
jgi:hypothetical protein